MGEASEEKILGKLAQKAVLSVFNRALHRRRPRRGGGGLPGRAQVDVSDVMPSDAYVRQIGEARPLHAA